MRIIGVTSRFHRGYVARFRGYGAFHRGYVADDVSKLLSKFGFFAHFGSLPFSTFLLQK